MENSQIIEQRESRFRSILKTLSWRVIATTTTVIIAYCVFGEISSALKVGAIEFFAKMFVYYFHERVWQCVPRGTVRHWFHSRLQEAYFRGGQTHFSATKWISKIMFSSAENCVRPQPRSATRTLLSELFDFQNDASTAPAK